MKLIARKNINIEKWNALVESDANASIYCQTVFLDSLAANWVLLVNEDYTLGMPIPYVKHLGIRGIYTPNFIRSIDFVGDKKLLTKELITHIVRLLKKKFSYSNLKMESPIVVKKPAYFVYQELNGPKELHTQAKRKIKKFQQSKLEIQKSTVKEVAGIITSELFDKVEYLKMIDFQRFETLVFAIDESDFWILSVSDGKDVLGGMIFFKWKNRLHYIKGGSIRNAKNAGAMYAMMDYAVDFALESKLILDFGGSNVEGVKQFNNSFGAKDVNYSNMVWNNAPFWFVILRRIKKMF